jgi:hypothetical protein
LEKETPFPRRFTGARGPHFRSESLSDNQNHAMGVDYPSIHSQTIETRNQLVGMCQDPTVGIPAGKGFRCRPRATDRLGLGPASETLEERTHGKAVSA